MNEKFLELAKESGFYVYNGLIFAETTSESMSAKMEKFAELIVKECANICDKLEDEYLKESGCQFTDDDNSLIGTGAGICCTEILDHFDVEL